MVTLDHRQRSAGPDHPAHLAQRLYRVGEVLKDEADKGMVERRFGVRHRKDNGDQKLDDAGPDCLRRAPRLFERLRREVDCGEARLGAVAKQRNGLRADAAAGIEDGGPRRIARIAVQHVGQGLRLVAQALRLRLLIAVNVVGRHGRPLT